MQDVRIQPPSELDLESDMAVVNELTSDIVAVNGLCGARGVCGKRPWHNW